MGQEQQEYYYIKWDTHNMNYMAFITIINYLTFISLVNIK